MKATGGAQPQNIQSSVMRSFARPLSIMLPSHRIREIQGPSPCDRLSVGTEDDLAMSFENRLNTRSFAGPLERPCVYNLPFYQTARCSLRLFSQIHSTDSKIYYQSKWNSATVCRNEEVYITLITLMTEVDCSAVESGFGGGSISGPVVQIPSKLRM